MLSVTIPWDLTSARVKMDVVEMELTAKVTVILSFYLISLLIDDGDSTRLKLVQEYNVPNFCMVFYRQQTKQNELISIRDVTRWVVKNKLSWTPLDVLN